MINNTMQAQTPNFYQGGALPDDTDRVSSIVGCDVNNYVFGDSCNFQNTQPVQNPNGSQNLNPAMQNNAPFNNKQNNSLEAKKGLLLLGILAGTTALLLKNKIKLPAGGGSFKATASNAFNNVKNAVTGFFVKFKKAPTPPAP